MSNGNMIEAKNGFEIVLDGRMFFWVRDKGRHTVSCYPVHVIESWDPGVGELDPFKAVEPSAQADKPSEPAIEAKPRRGRPPKAAVVDDGARVA